MAKKKVTKKARGNSALPEGYQAVGGFVDFWEPKKGDVLEGTFGDRREIKRKNPQKGQSKTMTIATITREDGTAVSIGESAMLRGLFEKVEDGDNVYIRFDGFGKKTKGRNPPRMYTVGIQEA